MTNRADGTKSPEQKRPRKTKAAVTSKGITSKTNANKTIATHTIATKTGASKKPSGASASLSEEMLSQAVLPARALFRASPMERIEMMKKGLPAQVMANTAGLLRIPQERLNQKLNIPRATVDRKTRENKLLSPEQTERLIGIISLVGQVEEIMADSGDESVEFDAGMWVAAWLEEPLPALGNRPAGEFMDTVEGQQLVSRLLAQSVSGAYV